jgi:hypothetical protein
LIAINRCQQIRQHFFRGICKKEQTLPWLPVGAYTLRRHHHHPEMKAVFWSPSRRQEVHIAAKALPRET